MSVEETKKKNDNVFSVVVHVALLLGICGESVRMGTIYVKDTFG